MMNAILFAVVHFFETVVNLALGGVLLAFGVLGVVALGRWLASQPVVSGPYGHVGAVRSGFSTPRLATAVLVIGVVCLIVGTAFRVP